VPKQAGREGGGVSTHILYIYVRDREIRSAIDSGYGYGSVIINHEAEIARSNLISN
jgi:hypothetical protein